MSVTAPAKNVKSPISRKARVKHPAVKPIKSSAPRELTIRKDYVAVLIPAHNEQADIADTISSLRNLRRVPDRILVISDNSTDNTVEIVQAMGVEVIETTGNVYKKAGALNAGFRHVIQDGTIPEFIITMDADTVFDENFVTYGLKALQSDPKLGVLSAVCRGKEGILPALPRLVQRARHLDERYRSKPRLLWQYIVSLVITLFNRGVIWLQQAEYARAGMLRIRQNIHSMSGAGSILRAAAVLDLLQANRGHAQQRAVLYEERSDNLVEDFVLTLDVKKHGWKCTNNFNAIAHTDLMRTLPALIRQRTRWVRGTVDELRRRKFSREARVSSWTLIYVLSTIPLYYLWPVLMGVAIVRGHVSLPGLWLLFLMGLYQALMTRKMGVKSMIVSFILIPDMIYGVIRHCWVISSVVSSIRSKKMRWE